MIATFVNSVDKEMTHMFVAVKDESGHYHLNGHLIVENGRSEIVRHMAGSKFKYKMLDDSRDYLYSLGPLQDSLIIQVCLRNVDRLLKFVINT